MSPMVTASPARSAASPWAGTGPLPVGGASELSLQNPWPGLAAYDEAASDFFHGRGDEAAELLRLIRLAPLTVVYGKSGLGKSSLLQAGLFPLLRAEHQLPVYVRMDFADGAADPPLEQVRRRLEEELDAAKAEYPAPDRDETLWEYLHRKDLEIWSEDNFPLTPVLVFDQFEELFSRSGGNVELVQHVFDSLADLIENRIPAELASESAGSRRSRLDLLSQRYRLVLSFREDFLPEVRAWEKKVPSLLRNYLRLDPMSRDRAIDAVEQAGAAVLDPDVAPCIVDFVGKRDHAADASDPSGMVIEPVLLSLCCSQLNRRRAPGGTITRALVDDAGQDILDSFYREALDDEDVKGPPDVALFIEQYLIQGDRFRGDYPREEALDRNVLTRSQLAALTDRHRLLRIVQHPDTARVELIHDRLVPVVRKARDERRIRQHREELERQADEQRRRAEEQERAATRLFRALWRARVFTAAALLAAVVAGFYAWKAARTADLASSRALATAAVTQAHTDPELGVLLALHAVGAAKPLGPDATREAADALSRTIETARMRSSRRMAGPIKQVAMSPDHTRLVLALDDGRLQTLIWPDLRERELLRDQGGKLMSPVFSPSGTHFAAIADDGTVRIWSAATGVLERSLKPPGTPQVVRFSPDGTLIAVGGDYTAWVWRQGGERPVLTLDGHKNRMGLSFTVATLAFHPSAPLLATGAGDNTVRLWDLRSGKQVKLLRGHSSEIECLQFSPDGLELVSGSRDATARVWNVASGQLRATLYGLANSVFSASYSRDGTKIATASADATARIWDVSSGREIVRLSSHSEPVVWAGFADEDRLIVSAGWDRTVKTWSASGHTGRIKQLTFSPDGRVIATAGDDGTIHLWDAVAGDELRVLTGQGAPVTKLRFSSDGRTLLSSDGSGRIDLWDRTTGEKVASLCCENASIEDLALSPDGSRLVSAANAEGVALWNVTNGTREKRLISGHSFFARYAAFSPDGRWIAATTDEGMLWIWSAADLTPKPPVPAHQGQVFRLVFAPDSATVMTAGLDGIAKLWNLASGERRELGHEAGVVDAVFTPDGSRLITSTLKGDVFVWDTRTGQRLTGPVAHAKTTTLDISADGTRLATFSWDRTAKVWDTRSWRELATLTHREQVDGGAISPDGMRLATVTPYDGMRIVPLDLGELTRLARSRVGPGRDLTTEECRRYLRRERCEAPASNRPN